MVARIKKNDQVIILSGKDKGKQGSVIEILPKKGKVMVQGVALVKRHVKARRQGEVSGIKVNESFIALSKVMPVCSSCKKPCRINGQQAERGRVRICNICKQKF